MQLSNFLYLWGCNVWVVLLYLLLCKFDEVSVAFVVFRQSMSITVRTVTRFASESQKANFFITDVASRMVFLFRLGCGWNFGDFKFFDLFFDALFLLVLSK